MRNTLLSPAYMRKLHTWAYAPGPTRMKRKTLMHAYLYNASFPALAAHCKAKQHSGVSNPGQTGG